MRTGSSKRVSDTVSRSTALGSGTECGADQGGRVHARSSSTATASLSQQTVDSRPTSSLSIPHTVVQCARLLFVHPHPAISQFGFGGSECIRFCGRRRRRSVINLAADTHLVVTPTVVLVSVEKSCSECIRRACGRHDSRRLRHQRRSRHTCLHPRGVDGCAPRRT